MRTSTNLEKHPCWSKKAHGTFARIHLPVAPMCNIGCKYCIRSINKVENRPGVASQILEPSKALEKVREAMRIHPLTVVGIAGPGDALANEETFKTFELIDDEFPELMKCISTNGLALPQNIERLKDLKVATLTVTINAVDVKTAEKIYDFVGVEGMVLKGLEAAAILIERQKEGVFKAVEAGITTKINSVLIPGINMEEIPQIAQYYSGIGADIMNIMPLIPLNRLASYEPPNCDQLKMTRDKCEKYIKQFRHCKQCRADAVGIPEFEKKDVTCPTEYFHF